MPSVFRKAEHSNVTALTYTAASPLNNREVVVNIVFGLFAVIFAIITLWQGHRWCQTVSQQIVPAAGRGHGNVADLELTTVPTSSSTAMDTLRSSTFDFEEQGPVSEHERAE